MFHVHHDLLCSRTSHGCSIERTRHWFLWSSPTPVSAGLSCGSVAPGFPSGAGRRGRYPRSGRRPSPRRWVRRGRRRRDWGASKGAKSASELCASEGIRTPNLLIRRHRPMLRPGAIRVLLSCRWRRREARLLSSLSELSSAHVAQQQHSHRFLIPSDPALTIGWSRVAKPSRTDIDDALDSTDLKSGTAQ
jgi:hypothetical protein